MNILSVSSLKRGFGLLDKLIDKFGAVYISVRGRRKYVIISIEDYKRLKEIELQNSISQAEKDYEEGRFVVETADEHFKRLGI